MELTNTVSLGCDISYWQGNVDFTKMRKAGIKAVIIRAGYGKKVDKNFVKYIKEAIASGLKIGVYWFMYDKGAVSAKESAQKCITLINPYKDHITLGVWADWEYDSDKNAGRLTPMRRASIVDSFCKEIQKAGYEVGLYSNQDYIQSGKFTADLVAKYPLWFAKYANVSGPYSKKGKEGKSYMWQYTSNGNGKKYGVSSARIDLNRVYINLEEGKTITIPAKKPNTPVKAPGSLDYSLVFDPIYYMNKYADLKAKIGNHPAKLLEHFLVFGINEGRQAHPDFLVTRYRDRYPDLQNEYGDNLYGYVMHYMIFGKAEGRKG